MSKLVDQESRSKLLAMMRGYQGVCGRSFPGCGSMWMLFISCPELLNIPELHSEWFWIEIWLGFMGYLESLRLLLDCSFSTLSAFSSASWKESLVKEGGLTAF